MCVVGWGVEGSGGGGRGEELLVPNLMNYCHKGIVMRHKRPKSIPQSVDMYINFDERQTS